MEDIGFNGTGSRSNSRFEAGSPIQAKQLNDLAAGLQVGQPMPYLGGGASVSFTPGGSTITMLPDPTGGGGGGQYLNQFHCEVNKITLEDKSKVWGLKVVSGSMAFQNEHQADQISLTEIDSGSPVTIVDGGDPTSIFTNHGGYCVLDEDKDYGVYLFLVQSDDRKKFLSYLYVADTTDFNYPSTGFVAYQSEGFPPGINLPLTGYSLQVLEIAYISWDSENEVFDVNQELIGSQTMPAVERPFQFKLEVINQNPDIEGDPFWVLRVAKGTVLASPEVQDGCISREAIDAIAIDCDPVNGYQEITPWCNMGGYYGPLSNDTDYDVWLFRISTLTDGVTTSIYNLWVGPAVDYTDACPVVLPTNIEPSGDYTAQAIYIGGVSQPYSADVWLVDQIAQGTLTFPTYPADVCSPFKVRKYSTTEGSTDYEVCEGMVNNIIPSNIADPVTVADGEEAFIWLAVGVLDGTPPTFPDPENVTIESGAAIPSDDDDYGYVGIAHIQTDGTISQLVNGSVWASRIKIGDDTAIYYYAGV